MVQIKWKFHIINLWKVFVKGTEDEEKNENIRKLYLRKYKLNEKLLKGDRCAGATIYILQANKMRQALYVQWKKCFCINFFSSQEGSISSIN